MSKGCIYLFPIPIAEGTARQTIPPYNATLLKEVDIFFVEKQRTAIRAIKEICPEWPYRNVQFVDIGKYAETTEIEQAIQQIEKEGTVAAILSEAGCPGIADPGRVVVAMAHRHRISVVPLVGPSSILMAMMSSGMNGQRFTFAGYLPREKDALVKELKERSKRAQREDEAQIFIETPYRNAKLFEVLMQTLPPEQALTIAYDITGQEQYIRSQKVAQWRKEKSLQLDKKPAIFIIGKL